MKLIHLKSQRQVTYRNSYMFYPVHFVSYYKNKLELKSNSSETLSVKCKLICAYILFFALKVKLIGELNPHF